MQVDLDCMVVHLFKACTMKVGGDGSQLEEWSKKLAEWETDLGDLFTAKKADATKAIAKRNWTSAMYRFDPCVKGCDKMKLQDEACDFMDDLGASPWLLTVRPSVWRYGAADFPLPGFGFFYKSLDTDIFLSVFNMAPLVEQGIVVADLASFAESPSGTEYFHNNAVVVLVRKGQCAFVPYGHIGLALYSATKEEEKQQPTAAGIVWTVFSLSMATRVEEDLWKSILSLNAKWHEKQSSSKLWGQRSALFTRFRAAASDHRSKHGAS